MLVDAELADGDLVAADTACVDLATRIADVDVPTLQARGACARARAMQAAGDPGAAVAVLEHALAELDGRRLPWARVTVLLALARARLDAGDRHGAAADGRAAGRAVDELDVVLPEADTTLLAALRGDAARPAPRPGTLARDGAWWTVSCDATTARLPDTKGLRYLAVLVAEPGRERHALDLVDRVEGIERGIDRRHLGDAGPALDDQARAAYRRRIEVLRGDIDVALELGHEDAAARAQDELQQLVGQLARAFGLDGRGRRDGSVVERARLNVTRALRSATARLAATHPAAAGLDAAVRTGMYCAYEPGPDDAVRWIVQSAVNERAPG